MTSLNVRCMLHANSCRNINVRIISRSFEGRIMMLSQFWGHFLSFNKLSKCLHCILGFQYLSGGNWGSLCSASYHTGSESLQSVLGRTLPHWCCGYTNCLHAFIHSVSQKTHQALVSLWCLGAGVCEVMTVTSSLPPPLYLERTVTS
jgi:hypothetical protein